MGYVRLTVPPLLGQEQGHHGSNRTPRGPPFNLTLSCRPILPHGRTSWPDHDVTRVRVAVHVAVHEDQLRKQLDKGTADGVRVDVVSLELLHVRQLDALHTSI